MSFRRTLKFKSVLLGLTLLTSACSFAPDYKAPDVAVPFPIIKKPVTGRPAMPVDTAPKGDWWTVFGDQRLNALENQVTLANQNLKIAVAQYDEARALGPSCPRRYYFPTVNANAGYERERTSKTIANPRPLSTFNDMLLGGDLSYEVDVWGRVRNAVAAGLDLAQASAADLATVALSLQ